VAQKLQLSGTTTMRKKLVKHGNSLALVIDKPILDLLNITAETELEITTDGSGLQIAKTDSIERRSRIDAIASRIERRYDGMFTRLAGGPGNGGTQ
jgi:antitoxin component of MazEF toxin-antitoxin module